MSYIHGGKAKNDRIDSEKIARIMRGGDFLLDHYIGVKFILGLKAGFLLDLRFFCIELLFLHKAD